MIKKTLLSITFAILIGSSINSPCKGVIINISKDKLTELINDYRLQSFQEKTDIINKLSGRINHQGIYLTIILALSNYHDDQVDSSIIFVTKILLNQIVEILLGDNSEAIESYRRFKSHASVGLSKLPRKTLSKMSKMSELYL